MKIDPLISVIITTCNRGHLLPRAINSVLNQTYNNFELIIVNDGSIDNTEDIIKTIKDGRIVYQKHEKNRGVLAAKNTGLDLSRGSYGCFLDDDDELVPDALEIVVKNFNKLCPEGTGMLRFDCIDAETGRFSGSGVRTQKFIRYDDVLCGRFQGDYWLILDMTLVGNNRFDERLFGNESILWLKLHRKTKMYYIPKILYIAYRNHGVRLSSASTSLKHGARLALTQKYFLIEFGEELKTLCPKGYGQKLAELGFYQILSGDKITGRETICESFKYGFLWKPHMLHFLSSIFNGTQLMKIYKSYIRLFEKKPRPTTAREIDFKGQI